MSTMQPNTEDLPKYSAGAVAKIIVVEVLAFVSLLVTARLVSTDKLSLSMNDDSKRND